jgi:5-methylcytosine-specific restriction endonuclease McrA
VSIRHSIRVAQSLVREALKRTTRSSHWRVVEKAHLARHPACEACGGDKRLQVHHIQPFHLRPWLELSMRNLITLCMGPSECHLRVGHRGRWTDDNPHVVKDAQTLLLAKRLLEKEGAQ